MTTVLDPNNKLSSIRVDMDGRALTGGSVTNQIPDYANAGEIAAAWDYFSGVNTGIGDFVTVANVLNGQSILAVSGSPLTVGESSIANAAGITQPGALEIAASFVRTGISFATASLYANGPNGAGSVPNPINIISCSQSSATAGAAYNATAGTVMQILLENPVPSVGSNNAVFVGDWVNVTGLVDNRLNYANLCINWISADRKTLFAGFSDEAALPSLAVATIAPALGSAKVQFYNNFSGARNAFGLRLSATTATSAAVAGISSGNHNQLSGTLAGDQRTSIASTAPNYVAGGVIGQYDIRANSRFRLECTPYASVLLDKAEQAMSQWTNRDTRRESVKPASGALLHPRFRLYKPVSMTRPVERIVSAVKTGTTTATVTTAGPHGLVTGNWVTAKGNRDTVNFAAFATPVQVTVLNATQFTIVWGAAVTATGYGGSVILTNGGRDQPGIIGQTIQNVTSMVSDGEPWLRLDSNASWTGINRGDYVNLHGVRSNTGGSDLFLDGAWEVAEITTTILIVRPVYDISFNRVSPNMGTLASTPAGGSVIVRPTLRSHDLILESWGETRTCLAGQGTQRLDLSMPTFIVGGTITANEGTSSSSSTHTLTSLATTNPSSVKTTAGNLFALSISNVSATSAFYKLYNKASAPTVGTDVPIMVIPVPANSNVSLEFGRLGIRFVTGLATAITRLQPIADATAVGANELLVVLSYQ